MDWDDLRYVLAIAREGGLNSAARKLDVNPSSVYRRLEALEATLEVRLFERLRSGYRLTAEGESLAEAAGRMESEAMDAERHIRGTDSRLAGHVRVSTSEAVAVYVLPPYLAAFRETYPGVTLDIGVTNQLVDLTRRDADVVIRGTTRPPEHLVGREVARIGFAAYGSIDYLDRVGRGRALADYEWIGGQGTMSHTAQAAWIDANIPPERIHLRFDSVSAVRASIAGNIACSALPCFVGDREPRFERLPNTHTLSDVHLWILTHPDLRKSARVRAFMRFFGERMAAAAKFLDGSEHRPKKPPPKRKKAPQKSA